MGVLTIALTIGAVAMVVGFIAVSEYVAIDDDPHFHTTVNLSSPSLVRDGSDEIPTWEMTSNVNKVTPRDDKIHYSQVRITIRSSDGTSMVEKAKPMPEDPSGTTQTSGIVQIWFNDTNDNGDLDAGDVMRITGISTDHEGALVLIIFKWREIDQQVGTIQLPLEFPLEP